MSTNQKAALSYASLGWEIFPIFEPNIDGTCSCGNIDCTVIGKHPRTPNGMLDATTDLNQISKWWSSYPSASIGRRPAEDEFILDLDGEGGKEFADKEEIPITPTVQTGNGIHILLKISEGYPPKNKAGYKTGLDIRTREGYHILPPSIHPNGKKYAWIKPPETPIEESPKWLNLIIKTDIQKDKKEIDEETLKFKKSKLRPCIQDMLVGKNKGALGESGDLSHDAHLCIVREAQYQGFSRSEIEKLFESQPDYKEEQTAYYVKKAAEDGLEKGIIPYFCDNLIKRGWCTAVDPVKCAKRMNLAKNILAPPPESFCSDELGAYGSFEELYSEVRKYITDYVVLSEDAEYDILTSYVFQTWKAPELNEVGYLFLLGPPGSGKTRVLETMAELCYNPMVASYTTTSCIFRKLNEGTATLILDEIQQYLKEDSRTFLAILNAGQRRGMKAIVAVPEGKDWVPREFDTFGPKILASTESTVVSLGSRCVTLPMIKSRAKLPLRVDPERGERLTHKLLKWQQDNHNKPLEDTEDLLRKRGLSDNRNIAVFLNLIALAPPLPRERILSYAKDVDDSLLAEDGLSFQADIFQAVAEVYPKAQNGIFSIQAVRDAYMEKHPGEELTNRYIGNQLSILGINKVKRLHGGLTGRQLPQHLYDRLRARYPLPDTQSDRREGGLGECGEGEGCKAVPRSLGAFMPLGGTPPPTLSSPPSPCSPQSGQNYPLPAIVEPQMPYITSTVTPLGDTSLSSQADIPMVNIDTTRDASDPRLIHYLESEGGSVGKDKAHSDLKEVIGDKETVRKAFESDPNIFSTTMSYSLKR